MAAILACPECDTKVRPPEGLDAGSKLKCPKCQTVFAIPGKQAALQATPPSASGSTRRPAVDDDRGYDDRPSRSARFSRDEDDDRPARSSRSSRDDEDDDRRESRRPIKKPKKKSSGGGLPVVVWLLIVLLLVGGAGAGVYFAFFNKDKAGEGEKDKDTGREGRLTNENFKRVKNGMTDQEVTRLLGPPSQSFGINAQGRQVRHLVWIDMSGNPPSQVTAEFADGQLIRIDGTVNDKATIGGNNPGGIEPFEPPGRLTAGNFKKVQLNMSEVEVLQLIGNASKVVQDRVQGRNRIRVLEWEDKGTAKPTKVTVGFADDFLIDASGTIDGQRVNARANTPGGGRNDRATQGNFKRVENALASGQPMSRAQTVEVLGPPTRDLGRQMSVNGQQADETLYWVNGPTQITIWFANGRNIGMKFHERN